MAGPLQISGKKRQIIAQSNRTMFFWIAGMSAVVGICLVLVLFLSQQLAFKTKVANAIDSTASTLNKNNKKTNELMDNLRVRSTDAKLASVKANPEDQPLQVILDALPADENALALGSSLQEKILAGVDGITIESLVVGSNQIAATDGSLPGAAMAEGVSQIPVSFVVTANDPNKIKEFLLRLERSLRVIDIDSLSLETSSTKYTMNVSGHAYYKAPYDLSLGSTVCKPDGKKC